ncbi:cytochrome P450 [Sistotremastrum suecicum HHB10207 ss-3]|uniref:Cytochrome P450 n=1 Tax=Sistotremastrum suecicum HHB10207 ss-3 TaxID=1314776 RepID=A0A166BUT3_9AGAM|nr:cytochrome P450 [Sistotremastrum suecicum HHB10207 ss-3]
MHSPTSHTLRTLSSSSLSGKEASVIVLGIIVAAAIFLRTFSSRKRSNYPYPPGPSGLLILGNALQVPLVSPWRKFIEWSSTYGDIIGLSILGRKVVVLNAFDDANDLLSFRGANYSDRPKMTLSADYGGWDFSLGMTRYGADFHLKRRFLNQSLNRGAIPKYHEFMTKHARSFADRVGNNPDQVQIYSRMHTAANILWMTYGYEVLDEDDKWAKMADEAVEALEATGTLGGHPIDVWPALGKLPFWLWGQKFVKQMEVMKTTTHDMVTIPYETVKEQMLAGTAVSSLTSHLILENTDYRGDIMHERTIASSAAIAYAAGADTSRSTLTTFFVAMLHYPRIQQRAHKFIDLLLKEQRLPVMEDREQLPYIEAMLKETHRWKPVLPAGIPHGSLKDDVYKGMAIPAGSMLITNLAAMLENPQDYPKPQEFRPERYVDIDGNKVTFKKDFRDPGDIAFGFGRRKCPGRYFADAALWITMATILALYEISPVIDEDGNPVLPDLEYTQGIIRHAKPFRCVMTFRSEKMQRVFDVQNPEI